MTTKLEQAARQALEALEQNTYYNFDDDIKALREALAEQQTERTQDAKRNVVGLAEQAEQEPVGYTAQSVIDWLSSDERTDFAYSNINLHKKPTDKDCAPLYAAPVSIAKQSETDSSSSLMRTTVRTKDLTPEEIKLPVDVVIGCGTVKAGCSLQTLLTRIKVINETWIPKMQAEHEPVIAADGEKNKCR